MSKLADLMRLPEEMRARRQWCVAGPDGKGTFKAPYIPGTTYGASVTNPAHWSDFETAVNAAYQAGEGFGVGYVLHKDDPFTIIDMDVKLGVTPQSQIDRYWAITQAFNSYTERSRSGYGLHVVVKGKLGAGCRRDGVEMYSQERFIVCTGDVVINEAPRECQEWVEQLAAQLKRHDNQIELTEVEEELTDMEIIDKLMNAVNGEKFNELCRGDWKGMGYPSQSEADLALMSMFCFHSASNEQCRRLFRMTPLGKRDKAVRDNVYLNRTLKIVRGRQARELATEEHGEQQAAAILANMQVTAPTRSEPVAAPMQPASAPVQQQFQEVPAPHYEPTPVPVNTSVPAVEGDDLPWPPGMMGHLAYHIYQNSPRPVKEVGIITALGLIAGICGRNYQLPQTGLNMYLVLVARSAVGKEAMHTGTSRVINELMMGGAVTAMHYVSFQDFASGPSLIKAVAENRCFVNISGEFGRKLKRLAQEDGRDGPMQQLRTVMTNLYQKSSIDSIVGGLSYSDKEKTVASVAGVAYSMIGETTPDTFYQSLTETMMEDGFLSRFTILEYNGPRPPLNTNKPGPLPFQLKDRLANLILMAGQPNHTDVARDAVAEKMMADFDQECDQQINSTLEESWRQMWNRAHLKMSRVAALLACFDNHTHPVINAEHVTWALNLIRRDIALMARRIQSGDVGSGDAPRERKLLALIQEFLTTPVSQGYGINEQMRLDGIVPRKFFQIRIQRLQVFTTHRQGSTFALESAVRALMDAGYLQEVDRGKLVEKYGFHGKAYRVVSAPNMPHK